LENQPEQYRRQLLQLLQQMGPENIWRPVEDERGRLLADGHEDMRDTAPTDLAAFDFQDKSVLDMGCNLGYYSFLAKTLGAGTVVGLDADPLAIQGCSLLSKLYREPDTRFICSDFLDFSSDRTFDVVLLINFIGKKSLVKGIQPILDVCRKYAENYVIVSARCRYHIRRSLGVGRERIAAQYGEKYVQGEWFDTMLFLQDYLGGNLTRLSPDYEDTTLKRTFLLQPSPSQDLHS
jgi:ribosomal protein L11 methyltransferase